MVVAPGRPPRLLAACFIVDDDNMRAALTRETPRLAQRGRITPGYIADIAIFDPDTAAGLATYDTGVA